MIKLQSLIVFVFFLGGIISVSGYQYDRCRSKVFEVLFLATLTSLAASQEPPLSSQDCAPCKKVVGETGNEPYIGDYNLLPDSNPACDNGCAYQLSGTEQNFCFEKKNSDYTTVNVSCGGGEQLKEVITTELVFMENGKILVQENNYNNKTGILEVNVPQHGIYSDTKFIADPESGTNLISTNQTCQVSRLPRSLSVEKLAEQLGSIDYKVTEENSRKYFVIKSREERVGHEGRKNISPAFQTHCSDQSVVITEDHIVNETDYQIYEDGGIITVDGDDRTRSCSMKNSCSKKGPGACGYGWTNPFSSGQGFSFHQVSSGAICVTCTKDLPGGADCSGSKYGKYCLCKDITEKKKLQECKLCGTDVTCSNSIIIHATSGFGPGPWPGIGRRIRQSLDNRMATVTQTLTFSALYLRLSVTIHVTPYGHDQELTIIMNSDTIGHWQLHDNNNRMVKIGNTCYVSTLPSNIFPIDIAVGLQEIKKDVTPEDEVTVFSVLMDKGPLPANEVLNLHPLVKEACNESIIANGHEEPLTNEQSKVYANGSVVFVEPADENCNAKIIMMNNNINDAGGRASWRYPNSDGESQIIVRGVIALVINISCCQNIEDPCCQDLCLCSGIVTAQDIEDCKPQGEVLLLASGTDGSFNPENSVQVLERQDNGYYQNLQINSSCSDFQKLPTKSSSGIGAVANSQNSQTVIICEGYTQQPPSKCYKIAGSAWVETDAGLPPNLLTNGGSSVVFKVDDNSESEIYIDFNIWWIVGTDLTGMNTVELPIPYIPGTYNATSGTQLPIEMNLPCIALVNSSHAFVTAIPVGEESLTNKAWLYEIWSKHWIDLPDTLAQRTGAACGILESINGPVAVVAGGYEMSSSEFIYLDNTGTWTNGPDIGEQRYGASMVSMMEGAELVLIGGMGMDGLVTPIIRVINENMTTWENKGIINPAVFNTVALRVPRKIIKGCL